ncbi:type II secretion system F family protein [Comamonadaceae bacterium PP-2]
MTATPSPRNDPNGRKPVARLYDWQGQDRAGRAVCGQMRADLPEQVEARLLRQGISGIRIGRERWQWRRRIRPQAIAVFTRQLAAMLQAGIPLLQSVAIIAGSHPGTALARLLDTLRSDLEGGAALSSAFARHPGHFGPLYCSLVAAGETAGRLDTLLRQLARHLEKSAAIQSKVRAALAYPATIVAVAATLVAVMMAWVVPAFQQMFDGMGVPLPWPTRLVLGASRWLADALGWLAAAVLAAGLAGQALLRRSPALRQGLARLVLRLPVAGPLLRLAVLARWARTLATLFAAGVPLVEALDGVAGAAASPPYEQATRRIRDDVAQGSSLAAALSRCGTLFPPLMRQMAVIGEESGALDTMLDKAADFYEQAVDDRVAGLSAMLEPLIILVLGALVGGLVLALYLPIFQLGALA